MIAQLPVSSLSARSAMRSRLVSALLLLGLAFGLPGVASALDHFRMYPILGGTGVDGPIVQIDDLPLRELAKVQSV